MTDYTMTLSGPVNTIEHAARALGTLGLPVESPIIGHGFESTKDEGWLRVQGPDVDLVINAAAPLEWRVRAYHHTPGPPEPQPIDLVLASMADMRAEIDNLKRRLGEP